MSHYLPRIHHKNKNDVIDQHCFLNTPNITPEEREHNIK